jgi:hypothetical protein
LKRSLYAPPDLFSSVPLVSLLPVLGELKKLEGLSSFIFARYEKVASMLKEFESASSEAKSMESELAMLKQVLDWLGIEPMGQTGG